MTLSTWAAIFLGGAAILVWAGIGLARAADELAERTGISRVLIGMLLVGVATSLPELVTDVSAALADAPDLAVGDLFGSSMANMAILAALDLSRRERFWPRVELDHARVASIAIGLTAVAALSLLAGGGPALGWVGLDTALIAGAYLAAVAWIRRSPHGRALVVDVLPAPTGWARATKEGPTRAAALRFAAATVVIFVSAPIVAIAGQGVAEVSSVAESFVGTALVAISTSLPELVASLAAIRIGAHDLAVGNLFGSNAANMAVLFATDLAYTPGPLLASVDPGLAIAAVGAILLMAVALAAIVHGIETRIRRLEPDAALLLAGYGAMLVILWRTTA